MKKILHFLIFATLRLALSFRYRIRTKGFDKLSPHTFEKPGGILFLPNHPTYFVDPMIVTLSIWRKFPIRPMIVEYMYFMPGIHQIMKFINALPVPNFVTSSNSIKKKKGEKVIQTVIDDLKAGNNSFLIYPAGKVKLSAHESIGGSSAVHRILQEAPETNIVLVRTKGLWGSRFSRAITDSAPPLSSVLWDAVKIILKNLIFFVPKREVTLEFCPAPADFPANGSRMEMNKYLEDWYNLPDGLSTQNAAEPGDSLVLVSYSMWKEEYPALQSLKDMPAEEICLKDIPQSIKEKIIHKLAQLSEIDEARIRHEMVLSSDLGLDSLDIAEIVAFLDDQFEVSGVPPKELTTVGKLMSIAAHQTEFQEETEDEKSSTAAWNRDGERVRASLAAGKTIAEVFLNQCQRMGNAPACADDRIGVQTYSQLKMRALILAEYIKNLPGTYIGILLPSSVIANIVILACQLANKVPLMVNWTVGPRHLESVVKLSEVKVVLSSWAFIDRLENVDFNGIEDLLVMLEDVRREISITDKIKGFFRSKRTPAALMKILKLDRVSEEDKAVLLFTSGTESLPKGVPLSHKNILSNLRAAVQAQDIYSDDVIYGILPPFHSFGFTVSGILGLLSGVRVAYFPDPTDGKKLAKGFQKWNVTIMCGAPTFIKGMLKAASAEQMSFMRLCVSGAEKAPPELFQMLEHIGKPNCLAEGYGITECSPILTLNPAGSSHKGVGKPLPGVELLIVNPETEVPVPMGNRGLILAKGPNIFSGYLNPGLSSPFLEIAGQTWYRTGDLGYVDSDNYLTISGRMKRFVKMGGEMISLASLEDALLQTGLRKGWPTNFEGPSLAVCAKELPGEKTKIFLFSRFDVSLDEINQSLKESGFSNLVKVSTVKKLTEIPVMGTGKVNYRVLEGEHLANGAAAS